MDKASQERLTHILGLDPTTLSVADQGFINGRQDYLTANERKDFVNEVVEVETEGDDPATDKYDAMTAPVLKQELKSRELSATGNVAVLRDRLRENDGEE
jgi:hypothetical protein